MTPTTLYNNLQVISYWPLERSRIVTMFSEDKIFMHPIDYGLFLLELHKGYYLALYNNTGVTDESIKASGEYAISKLHKQIEL